MNKPTQPTHRKEQTNLRLSDEGRKLLEAISSMYGIGMADVVEIAIRRYASELGLWKKPPPLVG